jgi:hypothetical protein
MSVYKKSLALQANRTILQNIDVGHDRNLKGVQNRNTLNSPFTVCSTVEPPYKVHPICSKKKSSCTL